MTTEESVVQLEAMEGIWVRGDRGVTNLAHARSVAVHRFGKEEPHAWMLFVHVGGSDTRAIPLVKCSTEEEANALVDVIAGLVGALDLRLFVEGGGAEDTSTR